jgi:hypothetical protein
MPCITNTAIEENDSGDYSRHTQCCHDDINATHEYTYTTPQVPMADSFRKWSMVNSNSKDGTAANYEVKKHYAVQQGHCH